MVKDDNTPVEQPELVHPFVGATCRCSLDIGGTLAKVVYYQQTYTPKNEETDDDDAQCLQLTSEDEKRLFPSTAKQRVNACHTSLPSNGGVLRLKFFRTAEIDHLISWLTEQKVIQPGHFLPVTGGGSFKFERVLHDQLHVETLKQDEMESAMAGLTFLLSRPGEVCYYDTPSRKAVTFDLSGSVYPFLLVNIGSGVSILKANGPGSFKRITGTCVGGGTVLGLARLLLGVSTFDEVVALSRKGSNALDLVVSDLYGDTAGSRCLPGDTLASSFGRLYVESRCSPVGSLRREDIARSLVTMVSYNLGYLAYLIGSIHNVTRLFFAGKFINNHDITMEAITQGVQFYTTRYCSQRFTTATQKSQQHVGVSSRCVQMSTSESNVCMTSDVVVREDEKGFKKTCEKENVEEMELLHQTVLKENNGKECALFTPSSDQQDNRSLKRDTAQPAAEDQRRMCSNHDVLASCVNPYCSNEMASNVVPLTTPCRHQTSPSELLTTSLLPLDYTNTVPGGDGIFETDGLSSQDAFYCRHLLDLGYDSLSLFSAAQPEHNFISQTSYPFSQRAFGSASDDNSSEFKVLFVKHDGYLGSLGALILAHQ